jgi:hypothetical protein
LEGGAFISLMQPTNRRLLARPRYLHHNHSFC